MKPSPHDSVIGHTLSEKMIDRNKSKKQLMSEDKQFKRGGEVEITKLKCDATLFYQFDGDEPEEFLQFNEYCSIMFTNSPSATMEIVSKAGKKIKFFVKPTERQR